jgi:hypothetical protein
MTWGKNANTHCTLQLKSDGAIEFRKGALNTDPLIVGPSAAGTIPLNQKVYLEGRAVARTAGGANGDCIARIDNSVVLSELNADNFDTALDAGLLIYNTFSWGGAVDPNMGAPWRIGSGYMVTATGARNITFLGNLEVITLRPASAGFYQEWSVVGAGTHVEAINDLPHDGDATYTNHTPATTLRETYGSEPLPSSVTQLYLVQLNAWVSNTPNNSFFFYSRRLSTGVDVGMAGANVNSLSYTRLRAMADNAPGMLATDPWTPGIFADMEYGYRKGSGIVSDMRVTSMLLEVAVAYPPAPTKGGFRVTVIG